MTKIQAMRDLCRALDNAYRRLDRACRADEAAAVKARKAKYDYYRAVALNEPDTALAHAHTLFAANREAAAAARRAERAELDVEHLRNEIAAQLPPDGPEETAQRFDRGPF